MASFAGSEEHPANRSYLFLSGDVAEEMLTVVVQLCLSTSLWDISVTQVPGLLGQVKLE
jgi:hypothetical protein